MPAIAVTPAELKANFFDINVDEGTAEAESAYGASFISVRYESGYLHIMQMSDAGPLYLTTVLARAAGEGKLMAVHTRVEYSPTIIPGFTSRPRCISAPARSRTELELVVFLLVTILELCASPCCARRSLGVVGFCRAPASRSRKS